MLQTGVTKEMNTFVFVFLAYERYLLRFINSKFYVLDPNPI